MGATGSLLPVLSLVTLADEPPVAPLFPCARHFTRDRALAGLLNLAVCATMVIDDTTRGV